MTDTTADIWVHFTNHFPVVKDLSDQMIFTLGTWISHVAMFWIFNVFLLLCRNQKWFEDRRIDANADPSPEQIQGCLKKLIPSHFLIQPVALYFTYPLFTAMGMRVRAPLPSVLTFLQHFIISGVCNDWGFYWAHRLLHHSSIYKYIHKQHHEFKATIGIAAEYAHPVEEILANLIPTLAGPFLLGSHVTILWFWLAFRIYETVDSHSGYLFAWSVSDWTPFSGGRERHYYHHSHNKGCYGAAYLDQLFQTDLSFLEYQQRKKQDSSVGSEKKEESASKEKTL